MKKDFLQSRVLSWSRTVKRAVVIALDICLAWIATWLAFTLRLDMLHEPLGYQWYVYALAPALALPIFARLGLYRAIFRYSGQAALVATAQAVSLYATLFLGILLWQKWPGVPRSVGILQPLLFFILVGISRAIARFWLAGLHRAYAVSEGRLLIYGAGTAGMQTASALQISGQFVMVGFVDDDAAKVGRSIHGLPVYSASQLPSVVFKQRVTDLVLALPTATRMRRREIIESLRTLPLHIRTLPDWADLASGRVTVQDFNELDVQDLLGRAPVAPDRTVLTPDLLSQVVLVTGAGGSIGSELCRQIVLQQPQQLLLLDHSEYALYKIHQELAAMCESRQLSVEIVPLLASVTHYSRLTGICHQYRPSLVYHAAAYKHVPLVEQNPAEGILNNVFGTFNMAHAALASGVLRFVLISTDKAVRPTNIMGASKRMAEMILQALADQSRSISFENLQATHKTCFTMVRFGNVLGSSGSVVPLFRQQIKRGGPITVTHPEVTRYFMTIPEAAQLVLQAGAMAQGGDVFVLDMGEPVKIMDLARSMVTLSGLSIRDDANLDGDIEIEITGLRPGEKLYEELLIGNNPERSEHPLILKAHEDFVPWEVLQADLVILQKAAETDDICLLRALLIKHVAGFETAEAISGVQ